MGLFSTQDVARCDTCDARTPHRRLRPGVRPALVALPVLGLGALVAGILYEDVATTVIGAVVAVGTLFAALRVLRRPACERCTGREWMRRNRSAVSEVGYVTFYNFLGQEFVFVTRRENRQKKS